jgi:hypothetical protein
MWNQNEVLHATFWGTTWEQWGTSWEHIENMMETREKRKIFLLLILSRKEKNWTCHESMLSLSLAAWNFCFENSLSPYLAWANGMEQPQKRKKKKFPLPTPPPQNEKKLGPSLMHLSLSLDAL